MSTKDYTRAQLEHWANMLLGVPFGAARVNTRPPLRPLVVSDAERLALASYLRRVAANPAALQALQPRRRRGQPSSLERDFKIALDYLATYERLGKAASAVTEVARAWRITRSTIFKARARCGEAAARHLQRLQGANSLQEISRMLRGPKY